MPSAIYKNQDKYGYGFIRVDEDENGIFFHMKSLRGLEFYVDKSPR
ncbi:MAG: cold shock domain-containing protein [Deltaproteobacteria bacterium]|nr:cold shock domain-containing protein [Deltaproteobacteria bacterium]